MARRADQVTVNPEGEVHADDVDIRVWHPSAPEWIRTRVRNDDSIVLELALGNVSLILPGDIGPAVERSLAGQHASPALPASDDQRRPPDSESCACVRRRRRSSGYLQGRRRCGC